MEIENEANRIVLEGHPIQKYFMDKAEAEKQFGFRLYQGGIVPGNNLRVVNIQDTDVEACCGTHCDNTNEVGWIKIFKTSRISDGILRLYYVAGKKVLPMLNAETKVINHLKDMWGINQTEIVPTAERIFKDYRRFENESVKQKEALLKLQVKSFLESKSDRVLIDSTEKEATLYFSAVPAYLQELSASKKSIVFWGEGFVFGLVTDRTHFDVPSFKKVLQEIGNTEEAIGKTVLRENLQAGKGKEKKNIEGAIQFCFIGNLKDKDKKLEKYFKDLKYEFL